MRHSLSLQSWVPPVSILRPGTARSLLLFASFFAVLPFCPAQSTTAKRPMTFEDMMQMKRLGDTAVSPDGKWLAYSRNHRRSRRKHEESRSCGYRRLWVRALTNPRRSSWRLPSRETRGLQFAPDGQADALLSGRDERAADVDCGLRSGDGRGEQCEEADGDCDRGRQREVVSRLEVDCVHVDGLSRMSRQSPPPTSTPGTNAMRAAMRCLAASKVKAQMWTHLLYRHWDHYTGEKREPSVSGFGRRRWNARSESG